MLPRLLVALTTALYGSAAYAQSAPSGSATLSGSQTSVVCRETVADGMISMPEIIREAGSAETLYEMSQGQLAEYDRWFVEMRAARAQGVAVEQIDAMIAEGEANYKIELEISGEALCYMSQ